MTNLPDLTIFYAVSLIIVLCAVWAYQIVEYKPDEDLVTFIALVAFIPVINTVFAVIVVFMVLAWLIHKIAHLPTIIKNLSKERKIDG